MKHTIVGTGILALTTVIETELLKERGITITEMIEQDKSISYINRYHEIFKDNEQSFKYLETFDKPQSKYHK